MKTEQLRDLLQVAEVAFAAEQAKLAQLSRAETELRDQLSSLASSRQSRIEGAGAQATPAARAGAEVRWHRWIDTRREALNRELAQNLAKRAKLIAAVRLAFGRKEALTALVARARANEVQQKARRSDHTS